MRLTIGCMNIRDRIYDPDLQQYLRSGRSGVDLWLLFNGFSRVRSYIGDLLEAHFGDLYESAAFIDETTDNGTIVLVRKSALGDGFAHFTYNYGLATVVFEPSGLSVVGAFSSNHQDIGKVIADIHDNWVKSADIARTIAVGDFSNSGKLPRAALMNGWMAQDRIQHGQDVEVASVGFGDAGHGYRWPVVFSVEVK